jgi:hypothetical protein
MLMRLPESGSVIGSIAGGLGRTTMDGTGIAVDAVTEPQLGDALDAMARGDIEYVILEDGDAFVQAAGDGAGPYALQLSPGSGDGLQEVRGGVGGETMRGVLLAYRRGDPAWCGSCRWTPL